MGKLIEPNTIPVRDDLTGEESRVPSNTKFYTITITEDEDGALYFGAESLAALGKFAANGDVEALRALLTPKPAKTSGTSGPSKNPVAGTDVVPSVIREWASAVKWTYPAGHVNAGKPAPTTGKLAPELVTAYIAANPEHATNAASNGADANAKPASGAKPAK